MNVEVLHKDWLKLIKKYTDDKFLVESLWQTIVKNYSGKSRYYHNLTHIDAMLKLAEENKEQIIDINLLLFAIWFHDIIYKSSKKNNEEKSAEFATAIFRKLSFKETQIKHISELIISTKKHQIILHKNMDNAFLLDFDLSILGQNWNIYKVYIQNIRKEYKLYPNFLYNSGRKNVLESFLNRKTLFFTEKYQDLFEIKARENLSKEIKLLS